MQGASQAVEDGVVLAVALELAGKTNIPLALKAWETIRYVWACFEIWLNLQFCYVPGIKE